ncbi:MAG: EAL domain-containing protein [Rhodospirillales bacterium]|nr:EAL domain-containing protein [Rhodospirillales bacterium]
MPRSQKTSEAAALRDALQRGEVIPYFQPLVAMRSGELAGFEVLARWPRSDGTMTPPAIFIPLAEQAGLIDLLTMQILRGATLTAAAWPDDLRLSVNLSPLLLRDHTLAERVGEIIRQSGFPLSRMIFEVTESALIDFTETAHGVIAELKAMGAQFAQDDFGTGYSSLRQLQALPFDKLKIDASFVRTMTQQRNSRKIIAAIIGLGISLGLSTVAEGVETSQQADMLAAMGCDLGQGWWFGHPVPASEVGGGIADGRWNRPPLEATANAASDIALRLEASPTQRLGQLQALYDGAPMGLALLDTQFRYLSLNQRLADIHDLPVAAHIGRSLAEIGSDLFTAVEPNLRRALRGEAVTNVRVRWAPASRPGQVRQFVISYYPVRDEDEHVVAISLAVIDVTERADDIVLNAPHLAAEADPALARAAATLLTRRQLDIIRLTAEGLSVKEIARELKIAIGTVKAHLSRAYQLLGARNRVEAIMRARLVSDVVN